ncbi:hypothetical protein DVH24_019976 [Malus domestica]|uniref:Late embryogenesis abundant protein LEA-2 subgroup domain-containing protein n=1 Tax=Malus domestica TaxID=3750 RepID=A0A498HZQ9_MALDO|nr:hypothetical protein DVH24_019976 [Malus domestica]
MAWKQNDAESLQSADELKRQKRIKLTIYIGIFIVFQIIVITAISLTVMKVKTPKLRLGNINVQELNSAPTTPSFDTKFTTQIRVKNTNFGPYKFDEGTVTFLYQGATVGQVSIPKSKAGMLSTKIIDVEVSLSSSALSSSNIGNELSSGVLTLNSAARLTGKVELMFIMKKKKASTMNCTIAFALSSKTLKSVAWTELRSWTLMLPSLTFGVLTFITVILSSSALRSSNRGSELSIWVLALNAAARLTEKFGLVSIMKKKKSSTMDCTIAFDFVIKAAQKENK